MIPFSILDLSPIREGATFDEALQATRDLARHAERTGYRRFWLAEHHGMPGIASTATSVLIGDVAGHTERIRVGAGGVMLPNHSPLVVAEQFGTLAAIHGERIDLGLGRAPGTDQATARALRHDLRAAHRFEEEVKELRSYFRPLQPNQPVRAIPAAGRNVPIWILGSSTDSARVAADLGLPYAFASHFAPAMLMEALALYRSNFRPSEDLDRPYVMVGANAVVSDTDAGAQLLFNSHRQMFRNVRLGRPGQLDAPIEDLNAQMSPHEAAGIDQMLAVSVVGSPQTAHHQVLRILEATHADELLFTSQIFDPAAALRSVELLAGVHDALADAEANAQRSRPTAV
ncbi:MAG: alkane 1-monooxygenase [Conexibacter sp.]|nr:alkane 1-monooxygenase [Conexibacter sp.]